MILLFPFLLCLYDLIIVYHSTGGMLLIESNLPQLLEEPPAGAERYISGLNLNTSAAHVTEDATPPELEQEAGIGAFESLIEPYVLIKLI